VLLEGSTCLTDHARYPVTERFLGKRCHCRACCQAPQRSHRQCNR
jgi:hypothetical protein